MADLWKTMTLALALATAGPALAQTTEGTAEAEAPATTEAPAEAPASTEATSEATVEAETAPAEEEGLALGEEVNSEGQVGATYIAEEHGAWSMRCVRTEEGKDPCQLYQLLNDGKGNDVAEISLFGLPEGGKVAAGATIITPLETLLTQQLTLSVDGGAAKRYPFTFCAPNGCFARIGFTADEVATFKRGAKAVLTIVPAAAPDQKIELNVSLSGFTAGYDAVNAKNKANTQ